MKEFVKVQDITKTYKMGEVEIHAVRTCCNRWTKWCR